VTPTIGRIVHYTLSAQDADAINRRRQDFSDTTREARAQSDPDVKVRNLSTGYVGYVGNKAEEGQVYPAMVVRAWGDTAESAVNLQVSLDGNDVLWATSVTVGEGPRTFAWPTRS
jgi:hypothetical protein